MLQQTVEEQERDLHWYRRRRRAMTPRRMLQESDELLFWVEECLVQEIRIVPGWLVARLMVVRRHARPELPARPGGGDSPFREGARAHAQRSDRDPLIVVKEREHN